MPITPDIRGRRHWLSQRASPREAAGRAALARPNAWPEAGARSSGSMWRTASARQSWMRRGSSTSGRCRCHRRNGWRSNFGMQRRRDADAAAPLDARPGRWERPRTRRSTRGQTPRATARSLRHREPRSPPCNAPTLVGSRASMHATPSSRYTTNVLLNRGSMLDGGTGRRRSAHGAAPPDMLLAS